MPYHDDTSLDCDLIDLTFPSPKQTPQHLQYQQYLPSRARRHPQHSSDQQISPPRATSKTKGAIQLPVEQSPVQGAFAGISPPVRRIDHVHRILRTSDPQAIQSVLLDLCKLSPALCGAIARGLAPHSTYAQATIKKYQHQKQDAPQSGSKRPAPAIKAERASINDMQKTTPRTINLESDEHSDSDDSVIMLDSPKPVKPAYRKPSPVPKLEKRLHLHYQTTIRELLSRAPILGCLAVGLLHDKPRLRCHPRATVIGALHMSRTKKCCLSWRV